MSSSRFTRIKPNDDVIVALTAIEPGEKLDGITVLEPIPKGHKIATRDIRRGEPVRKYATPIGLATKDIPTGSHVHLQNVGFDDSMFEAPQIAVEHPPVPPVPDWAQGATFQGYRRRNGVGTQNVVALISTVNCSATVTNRAAELLRPELAKYPNVDDIVSVTHSTGCGVQVHSPQHEQMARCLANLGNHPNVHSHFYIGLGCEAGQFRLPGEPQLIQIETKLDQSRPERRTNYITLQDAGGSEAALDQIVKTVREWLPHVNEAKRESVSASELILGMNCGGSDGFSGLTANPLLGRLTDILAGIGATSVLAETTETWGAHLPLVRRAANVEVGNKFLGFFDFWRRYMKAFTDLHGHPFTVDGNPSDGNKRGGITTIVEKSLGAAAKGGTTTLNAAYAYGERIEPHKGFTFMDTPGLDQVSVSGLLCGGCNLIVFTTGRGSCLGTIVAPTYKVATNTEMFNRMNRDMDFNAGRILDGDDREELVRELFFDLLDVASGKKKTHSQRLGYGRYEFQLWDIGPTY
ncbi:MAG: altronate dehydratase family protein [Bdellovibrionota bacterium]